MRNILLLFLQRFIVFSEQEKSDHKHMTMVQILGEKPWPWVIDEIPSIMRNILLSFLRGFIVLSENERSKNNEKYENKLKHILKKKRVEESRRNVEVESSKRQWRICCGFIAGNPKCMLKKVHKTRPQTIDDTLTGASFVHSEEVLLQI